VKINVLLAALSMFALAACSSGNEPAEAVPGDLQGVWVVSDSAFDEGHYHRAAAFEEQRGGWEFNSNGSLIRRQIDGWCATPPLIYANYQGGVDAVTGDTITVHHGYWGGTLTMTYRIVTLTQNDLELEFISETHD